MRLLRTSLLVLGLSLIAPAGGLWADDAQPAKKEADAKKGDEPKKEVPPGKKEADAKKVEEPKKEEPPAKPEKEEPAPAPAGSNEEAPPISGRPPLELIVVPGQASAMPFRRGVSFANGGVTAITQPNPTTIVVTMTGLTATNANLICTSVANYQFELTQGFSVAFNSRRVKAAKLTVEGRVIGLLRTNHRHYQNYVCTGCCCGTAETAPALAGITTADNHPVVSLSLPPRAAAACQDLSVYDRQGPICVPVACGKYVLHESWGFGTTHPAFICRGASAEFAPQPQYYGGGTNWWFQDWIPFNGAATRDFGFQVTITLMPETVPAPKASDSEELPPPKEVK